MLPVVRKFLVSFILLFLWSAAFVYFIINPVYSVKKGTDNSDVKIHADQLKMHVNFLTSLKPTRSYKNRDSLEKSAEYIREYFTKYCDSVGSETFTAEGKQYENIICGFPWNDPEKIVIWAHYDAVESTAGADDNASGIAGLLELSRTIKENGRRLPNTVNLVAYTLEEPLLENVPCLGSYTHAKKLYENKESVKFMVSLEMIGYFSDAPDSQSYPLSFLKLFYPSTGNFIAVVGQLESQSLVRNIKKEMIQSSRVDVWSINAPRFIADIDRSDHRNFWWFGFPAVMVTDTAEFRNKRYHTVADTPETLDYDKISEVVKGIYWLLL